MIKFFRLFLALLFPAIFALLFAAYYVDAYFDRELTIDGDQETFILEPGTGFSATMNEAVRRGWLEQADVLKIYGRLFPGEAAIRAGEYRVSSGTTVRQWLDMMRNGDVVRHQLTLVEGWTLQQVLAYLSAQELLAAEEINLDEGFWQQLGIDAPLAPQPEGLFFPDTYDYRRGDSPSMILRRAYRRLVAVLENEWQNRSPGLPYESPYEALIMASIVEKETGVAAERAEIAGVFVRRLELGMRLQTDPTVIYGMGERYRGNLRRRDLKDASNRYNTYRIDALPPTPIALAGKEAIHAALHPAEGDYLFFVARGDGSHQFSRTLAEHEEAVQRYQKSGRRQDYRSSPPPAKEGAGKP